MLRITQEDVAALRREPVVQRLKVAETDAGAISEPTPRTEQAALKCVYLAIMSLDPPGARHRSVQQSRSTTRYEP